MTIPFGKMLLFYNMLTMNQPMRQVIKHSILAYGHVSVNKQKQGLIILQEFKVMVKDSIQLVNFNLKVLKKVVRIDLVKQFNQLKSATNI
jgi:hypothetical protein